MRGPPGAASRGTGPRPASPSRFIHSEPAAAAPLRSRPGRDTDTRPRGRVGPQPPPRVRAPSRFPRARGLRLGWSERPRRPAPKTRAPQARGPTLRQGAGQAFPARGPTAWEAPIPAAGLPHCGRKSPRRPLLSARLSSPPRPDPLSAASGLPARAAGRRKRGATPPGPSRGQEQSG